MDYDVPNLLFIQGINAKLRPYNLVLMNTEQFVNVNNEGLQGSGL